MVCRIPRSPSATQSIVGQHKDPQPQPKEIQREVEFNEATQKFLEECLKMNELDYALTSAYLYQKRLEKQLKGLADVKEAIKCMKRDRPKLKFEFPECLKGEEWLKQLTKFRLTHYKLLIAFWEAVQSEDFAKTRVVVKCMCSNAGRIDEAASELVALGSMTEMDYKNVIEDTGEDYTTFDMMCKASEEGGDFDQKFHQFREAVRTTKPRQSRIVSFVEDVHRSPLAPCQFVSDGKNLRVEMNLDF